MKLETKYEFGELLNFGNERGIIVEVLFKPNSEALYTIQWLNPFSKMNIQMSESDITMTLKYGQQLIKQFENAVKNET